MKNKKEEEPTLDESQLTPEQLEELHHPNKHIGILVFIGTILVIIIILIIVIFALGGPVDTTLSN